jgi:hypothetical protein
MNRNKKERDISDKICYVRNVSNETILKKYHVQQCNTFEQ